MHAPPEWFTQPQSWMRLDDPHDHYIENGAPLAAVLPGERKAVFYPRIVGSDDGLAQAEPVLSDHHPNPDQLTSAADSFPDLVDCLSVQRLVIIGSEPATRPGRIDRVCSSLVLPQSERWREAAGTALLGSWSEPLWSGGILSPRAMDVLRAEARVLHRSLVPLWRRGTRHGRVLSLDAGLGDGLSLYNLVAADVDDLARTVGEVFEDERLNRVLRGLDSTEQQVLFAYAEGEGTTWTEAAAAVGASDPEAFGERVRRKAKRLAAEQARRVLLRGRGRHDGPSVAGNFQDHDAAGHGAPRTGRCSAARRRRGP
ncbi:hypothetical protein [Streptomyces chartreusis]|uniref:hypothetical protein n=1 Tax=Streptomyces chartreusis TaxID=1969 RepID=UPI0036657E19